MILSKPGLHLRLDFQSCCVGLRMFPGVLPRPKDCPLLRKGERRVVTEDRGDQCQSRLRTAEAFLLVNRHIVIVCYHLGQNKVSLGVGMSRNEMRSRLA